MSKSKREPDPADETLLIPPVQIFTRKAIRVVPGMPVPARLGRPDRRRAQQSKGKPGPRRPKNSEK